MQTKQEITGVILAGGQSRRFGSNKALALWRGKPLIQHVAESMSVVFSRVLLSTNSPEEYDFLGLEPVQDEFKGLGPLAGIHAALMNTATPWIFIVGCDMPAVTPDLIAFLCGFTSREYAAVIPWPETGAEPLCGLYHQAALVQVELHLKKRRSKVTDLLRELPVRKITVKELETVPGGSGLFNNINEPRDLADI